MKTRPIPETMTDIILYVKDNACRPISTSCVAKVFSISQGRLSRNFTKQTGETLLNFRDRIRIAKAKRLLAESITVETVASEVGFLSLAQFHRIFRKHTNNSPMQFRKSLFQD